MCCFFNAIFKNSIYKRMQKNFYTYVSNQYLKICLLFICGNTKEFISFLFLQKHAFVSNQFFKNVNSSYFWLNEMHLTRRKSLREKMEYFLGKCI